MLHTLDDLKNLAIHASDGDIGQTKDFILMTSIGSSDIWSSKRDLGYLAKKYCCHPSQLKS